MKRIRKPTDKEIHSVAPVRRKVNNNNQREKQAAVVVPVTLSAEPRNLSIEWHAPSVTLSLRDRASQLTLSEDQMSCRGAEGGYRMIRATHGVHNGAYYWECQIVPTSDRAAHVRLGWSTRQGELQAPVGYDRFSFAYRDISGSKIHSSSRDDKYGLSFGPGDIIGCYLFLDDQNPMTNQMRFFKNGKDQGIAYSGKDLPSGVYFPAVSLYMKAEVSVNFGPSFILRHDIYGANAVSEVQPMSPEDRKVHEARIAAIRDCRLPPPAPAPVPSNGPRDANSNPH